MYIYMHAWFRNRTRQPEAVSLPPLPVVDLPAPVAAQTTKKSARIGQSALKVRWSAFKKRLGTGSALSESLLENEELENSESNNPPSKPSKQKEKEASGTEEPIDEIVVDNLLASDETHKSLTDPGGTGTGGSPEKSAIHGSHPAGTSTDRADSLSGVQDPSWAHLLWTIARWRIYPNIHRFFFLRFYEDKMESLFQREAWFTSKRLALSASIFYVTNWLIGCVLLARPHLMDKIFYFGISPPLTLPLPFLVIFDVPRRRNTFYQIYLAFSAWMWAYYSALYLILCGFYPGQKRYFECGDKDFLAMLYYAAAIPAIAQFGLGQQRLPTLISATALFLTMTIEILPYREQLSRSFVNFYVFQMFLLWLHYLRENADRRLYSLRDQLKIQVDSAVASVFYGTQFPKFRATQKAQVNERKTADSKRRLTSYIFHEVRVPLNTALLAVQNMEAHGSVHKDQAIEFAALEGSLSMMSKVLNDVLDFNRMDSGRFESVARPYSFHTVIRSMLVPLRLAADARGLELHTEMDPRIDEVSRRAWYQAQEETPEWIENRLLQDQEEEGIVVGDESRLRQILTNIASNACKFTPSGGEINIRTKLIVPALPEAVPPRDSETLKALSPLNPAESGRLSIHRLSQHNLNQASPVETIVVRIEIQDTGVGIRSRDLVDNKLFSPYVQTEIGRTQGGKGTGLGLALVKHIVKLSGGRLGVRSELGVGSTFWVELRLGVGKKVLSKHGSAASNSDKMSKTSGHGRFGGTGLALNDIAAFSSSIRAGDTPGSELMASSHSLDSPPRGDSNFLPNAGASALKTIMEQGGLVELLPRRPVMEDVHGQISASFSGDIRISPDNAESVTFASTSGPDLQQRGNRPSYVAMPKREPMLFANPFSTPSLPPSPGANFALTQGSPSTESSLRFEQTLSALVVDDDLVTRSLMSRMLNRLGVNVWTAENGAIALDMILGNEHDTIISGPEQRTSSSMAIPQHEHRFDVVFLDNQMPVMSGIDVIRRLRAMSRTDFVVGVTGNALMSDQEEYLEAGVNRILTKPVQERSLKSSLYTAEQLKRQRSSPVHERQTVLPVELPKTSETNAI